MKTDIYNVNKLYDKFWLNLKPKLKDVSLHRVRNT